MNVSLGPCHRMQCGGASWDTGRVLHGDGLGGGGEGRRACFTVLEQEVVLETPFCGCCVQSVREGVSGKIFRNFGGSLLAQDLQQNGLP